MKASSMYKLLLLIRFLIIFIPLPGYIHPDEFFQSAEVIAGDVFSVDTYRPWEFQSSSPIRTTAFSSIICGIPFYILKFLSKISENFLDHSLITTYTLLIVPRISIALFSLLLDLCVFRMCVFFKKERFITLVILSTSYITYTYHGRPFSNTVEAVLFAGLLYFVLKSFRFINALSSGTKNNYVADAGNPYCFEIAILTAAGIFNRPTFALFAIAPVIFWIQYGINSAPNKYQLLFARVFSLIPSAYVAGLAFVLWDTYYYEQLTINELTDGHIFSALYHKAVLTPLNFIKYNTKAGNLAKHGLHPPWLHAVLHLPMLFVNLALYGTFGYWKMIYNLIKKGQFNEIDSLSAMMTCSFVIPLLLLSLFPHQEPRFLTPLLVPLIFLHSDKVWWRKHRIAYLIWFMSNAVMFMLYGILHQGGLIPSLLQAANMVSETEANQKFNFVFYHTYMPPRHLINVPLLNRDITFRDLEGGNVMELTNTMLAINSSNSHVFLFTPDTVADTVHRLNDSFHVELIMKLWPHLSTEDFPSFDSNGMFSFSYVMSYFERFALNIYNISNKETVDIW